MKKKMTITIIGLLLAVFTAWLIIGNKTIEFTHIDLTDEELPDSFDELKIVQISDLHNTKLVKDNEKVIDTLSKEAPDIIVITGDVVDTTHTDIDMAMEFVQQLVQLAPCYYVTGNHEAALDKEYRDLEKKLQKAGVIILHDEAISYEKNGQSIQIIGVDDPAFMGEAIDYIPADTILEGQLSDIELKEGYTILLSHRPEAFQKYVKKGIDLVFSGHVHGGQIRLPFVGGLLSPDISFFPTYDAGVYEKEDTTMIVSRGIGNSVLPIRVNNTPEIVVVEVHK